MNPKLLEGIDKDIDVKAIVTAFEAFRDGIQFVSDSADRAIVDLPFESSLDAKTHYSFAQDELVTVSGVTVVKGTSKIGFTTVYGAKDKVFFVDDAELITVYTPSDEGEVKQDFRVLIDEQFNKAFAEAKVNSIKALQAMIRNNPPLGTVLNESATFLEEAEKKEVRESAYSRLKSYGIY